MPTLPSDEPRPYDLERFVQAQDTVWPDVLAELQAGHKRTHWMWFVFPQLAELGRSQLAKTYGIGSLEEARAYLRHPVLGPRLRECLELLLQVEGRSAYDIFGTTDEVKLRSCLTLFLEAEPGEDLLRQVLARYYAGVPDSATLDILRM